MREPIYIANIGEFIVRNTRENIVKFAEAKGYEAQRQKDQRMADFYWQHAEHWKKEQ